MSNYRNSNVQNVWNINPKESSFDRNSNARFKGNEMHGMQYDDSNSKENQSTKYPWNQVLMRCDTTDAHNSEDYQLSSSLKNIWNDVSPSECRTIAPTGPYRPVAQKPVETTQTQTQNLLKEANYRLQSNSANRVDKTVGVLSNSSYNANRGRPIMSRNNGYMPQANIQNGNHYQVPQLRALTAEQQKLQMFLEQVQIIVQNGFLDPKILEEPLASDTHFLVEMLVHYVMEYGNNKKEADASDKPEVYHDTLRDCLRKINLIQNEIEQCQFRNAQQKRAQQEIVESFTAMEAYRNRLYGQRYKHPAVSGTHNQMMNRGDQSPSFSGGHYFKAENERYVQRQIDQLAQQSFSGCKYTYFPNTKNAPPLDSINIDPRNGGQFGI